MGALAARFVCGGGGGAILATTGRSPSAVPALGDSSRTRRARHLVCHLCLRAQARGFRAQADSEGLSGPGRSHSLRGATRPTGPVDHAFPAQLQGSDRFSG